MRGYTQPEHKTKRGQISQTITSTAVRWNQNEHDRTVDFIDLGSQRLRIEIQRCLLWRCAKGVELRGA